MIEIGTNRKPSVRFTITGSGQYTVSQKNCANLYLSELCQISTNFDDFWQKDGKEAKIMTGALIFHLT